MTAQQHADQLLREHQLTRLLSELELDIATVVTAHYDPQPETGIDLSIEDWGLINDQPNTAIMTVFEEMFA